MDEHHPLFSPEEHPLEPGWIPFLFSVGRALGLVVLTAAGVGMVLALIGCDDYERAVKAEEFRTKVVNACLPEEGQRIVVVREEQAIHFTRIDLSSGRYARSFPHVEVRISELEL